MKRSRLLGRTGLVTGAALTAVITFAGTALAAPPPPLPRNADALDQTYQPAYDYDTDGCYPTAAIGPDGTVNGGLKPSGALNGQCRDASDLEQVNGYSRAKCNNGWCVILYALYFEKDQALPGIGLGGHRHDWEHVAVWVKDGRAEYVSTSAHGQFDIHTREQIRWDGTHPKIVYHKDGIGTHCFRPANGNDEPPENHYGTWQFPDLVGWNGYPPGVREKLASYDFGSAHFGLKDSSFASHLAAALPPGVPLDVNA
ncbi:NPP1 family protein [Streptomyces sp. KLOTTS4A1]|uniref:NPP1 family protein n=1 Tax=Streptomyces sp. KLOTTS4A1 TaxID=3390996 RepID=UPI0039F4B10A